MIIKRLGGRARPLRMVRPKPSPIPRSFSFLNQMEDYGGDDGNYSTDTDTIVPETQSDDEHGVHENVTPDCRGGSAEKVGVNAEKSPVRDVFGGNVMEIDSLEEETCIKCDGGGQVLFCCETGCPVALHEKCVGRQPLFDEMGKFYCPYCLYKRAVARTCELRKKAMDAKRGLSIYLDPEVVRGRLGDGKRKKADEKEPDISLLNGNMIDVGHENILDDGITKNRFGEGKEPPQREGKASSANHDQHREVLDHQKHPLTLAAHDRDNICHGQEKMIKGIGSLQDKLEREKQCEDGTSSTTLLEVLEVGKRVRAEGKANLDQHKVVVYPQKDPLLHAACDSDNIRHGQEEMIKGIDTLLDNLERENKCEDETSSTHHFDVREVGEGIQAEDSREHERAPNGVAEARQQAKPCNACHTNKEMDMNGSHNTSTKQGQDNAKMSEEIPWRNEEQMQPIREITVSSTRDEPEGHMNQRNQKTGQPRDVYSPSKLATQMKDVAEGNARSLRESPITSKESRYKAEQVFRDKMEKDSGLKKSTPPKEYTMQDQILFGGKRKSRAWTAEEVEMLEKGVKMISSNVNKNIPWRKILEFGSHVFDPTRNPSDLKDKWKRLKKTSK